MDRYRMMPNYRFYDVEGASPLTLNKSVGKPLRDYKIYGNSVNMSKNLFDVSKVSGGGVIVNADGSIIAGAYGLRTKTTLRQACPSLKAGDVCVLSGTTTGNRAKGVNLIMGSTIVSWSFGNVKTITEELLDAFLIFYCSKVLIDGATVNQDALYENIQIEYGEVATDYESFNAVPVGDTSRNLFDEESAKDNNNWGTDGVYKHFLNFVFKKGVHYTISMSDNLCCKDRYPFTSGQVAMCVTSKNTWSGIPIGNSTSDSYKKTEISIYNETEETYLALYYGGEATLEDIFETLFPNFQIEEGETATEYEPYIPYGYYRIPVEVNGKVTDIDISEPLADGDYIDFINQKLVKAGTEQPITLPKIKTDKGTNYISVGTKIPPSNIKIQYYK